MRHADPVTRAEQRLRECELVLGMVRRAHRDAALADILGAPVIAPTEEDVTAAEVAVIEARDGVWDARHGHAPDPGTGGLGLFALCLTGLLAFLALGP